MVNTDPYARPSSFQLRLRWPGVPLPMFSEYTTSSTAQLPEEIDEFDGLAKRRSGLLYALKAHEIDLNIQDNLLECLKLGVREFCNEGLPA